MGCCWWQQCLLWAVVAPGNKGVSDQQNRGTERGWAEWGSENAGYHVSQGDTIWRLPEVTGIERFRGLRKEPEFMKTCCPPLWLFTLNFTHSLIPSLTQLFSKDWSMFWSYPSAMQTHKSNQDLLAWMHAQSCPTLHDPTDCRLPGYSDRGVFQARILEWVALSCSRGSSPPGIEPLSFCISCTGRWVLYHCATWETPFVGLVGGKEGI